MALEFGTMSRRGQWGIIGLLCAALLTVFYIYIWSPQQEEVVRLQDEISEARLDIQRTQRVAEQLPDLEESLAELERRLGMLSIILPDSTESDRLLRSLQGRASDTNLNVQRVDMQDAVVYDFYAEKPFQLELTGDYHNLARFFEGISKMARVINVDEVTIEMLTDGGTDTVQATCTAKTFYFIEEEETGAQEPGSEPGSDQGDQGGPER